MRWLRMRYRCWRLELSARRRARQRRKEAVREGTRIAAMRYLVKR